MPINLDNDTVIFESVIYEDEIEALREFLQEKAPQKISFDFKACDDIHLATMQLIMAYKKMYDCDYTFAEDKKLYQMTLEGFDTSENHCN